MQQVNLEAQEETAVPVREVLKAQADQAYGIDDFIIQGRKYQRHDLRADGYPWFSTLDWKQAKVYSHGRTYPGMLIQYDIEKDILIIQYRDGSGRTNFIYPQNEMIDSFAFDTHLFINLQNINKQLKGQGFYELVYSGHSHYVLKHRKNFILNLNSMYPYGTYGKQLSSLHIVRENLITACPGRKIFLQQFPLHKKEIRKYSRQQHIKFRKATTEDLLSLCSYADKLKNQHP